MKQESTLGLDPADVKKDELRRQIAELVDRYAALAFADKPFTPGSTVVPPSGKVIGAPELGNMVEAVSTAG